VTALVVDLSFGFKLATSISLQAVSAVELAFSGQSKLDSSQKDFHWQAHI